MTERSDPRRGLASASIMARLKECPGSLALTNELKRSGKYIEIPSPYAESGTRIHRWLYLEALGAKALAELAAATKAMSTAELGTAQKCAELRSGLLSQWAPLEGNQYEWILEKRLWYRQGLWPRFSGQQDFAVIDRTTNARAFLTDYKSGRKEAQESSDNLQLRTGAVLLKEAEPTLEEIDGSITEPLVSWDPVRVRYTNASLLEGKKEIVGIVDRAEREPTKRIAGTWCGLCPARANCREAADYVALPWCGLKPAMFKADKADEDSPFVPSREMIEKAIIELPRGEPGVKLWQRIKLAKKVIETLEATYTRILEAEPSALPGYVLPVEGKERRSVPYPAKLKAALAEYLTPEEIDGAASFHLTKIEEVLGLKHHLAGKDLERLFEKLTKNAVAIGHDASFIRPQTKREREEASKLIDAQRAAFGGPEPKRLEVV
jgi:hypothetical protein